METSRRVAGLAAALLASAISFAFAAQAETLTTEAGPVEVQSLAKIDSPWGMAFMPDGGLLITQKAGQLRIFKGGKLSEPLIGVPKVAFAGQGGLLDVEIDPKFAANRLVYLSYAEAADPQPAGAKDEGDVRFGQFNNTSDIVVKGSAVARGRLEADGLHDVKVIWRQEPKTVGRGHFGGRLAFAPDGTLFITAGERQRFEPAQDPHVELGKVLRINSDGSIPKDNPFADGKAARPEVWSMGHRNPLGAAINPWSHQLWETEMGPKGGDELNAIVKGHNYGWPIVSEGVHYSDAPIPKHASHPEFTAPVMAWVPSISPSGLAFYTGGMFPKWKGSAFLGALGGQALVRVSLNGDKATGYERIATGKRIRDVIQAPDGALLLLVDGEGGELLRLTPGK